MLDINIEKYIEGLSPELQEKARGCTTAEELLKLADENDVELPQEALDAVSGGAICSDSKRKSYCRDCGSENIGTGTRGGVSEHTYRYCRDCQSHNIGSR